MNKSFKLCNTVLQQANENTLADLSTSGSSGPTGATTPNPGSIGQFTINGTDLYVWNGSLWVLFIGISGDL